MEIKVLFETVMKCEHMKVHVAEGVAHVTRGEENVEDIDNNEGQGSE